MDCFGALTLVLVGFLGVLLRPHDDKQQQIRINTFEMTMTARIKIYDFKVEPSGFWANV
jgi:hypothetical protein